MKNYSLLLAIIIAVLYGVSFQQYLHFNLSDKRGIDDASSYIEMTKWNYNVTEIHRYRFIIPMLANPTHAIINDEEARLRLYIINFIFMSVTALLFYKFLINLGFASLLSLLGITFFICNRIAIISTATPLVDSILFLAIIIILYLIKLEKYFLLISLYPVLILTKEPIIPFLFLPLLDKIFYKKSNVIYFIANLVVSLILMKYSRIIIDSSNQRHLSDIIEAHMSNMWSNFLSHISIRGIHDFQNGFSLVLLLAGVGLYFQIKYKNYAFPLYLYPILFFSIIFMLLSGNFGRMVFLSFPIIIPYALITIDTIMNKKK